MRPRLLALVALILALAASLPAAAVAQTVPAPTATATASPMPTGGATPDMLAMTALMDHDCGLTAPAFCDTFDAPSPGGRAGDLNDADWSFARLTEATNGGQGMYNWFAPTDAMFCRTPVSGVLPPQDSFFCNAGGMEHMHWMTALNDAFNYAVLSAEVRRPFDFANRTGVVTFGVDAVTRGPHSWWPSVVITDQPVAGPHPDHPAVDTFPRNGVSISFDTPCAQADSLTDATSTTVGEFVRWDNYAQSDVAHTPVWADPKYCIAAARDTMNRIQVRVSQDEIQVWGSDAGTDTLKLMADAKDLHLPFTRGYVSLQQSQYAAAKFNGADAQMHTYHWHDVGFDGPALPTPRAYEVPDAMTPKTVGDVTGLNLGWALVNGQMYVCCDQHTISGLTLSGVDLTGATGATLSFDANQVGFGGGIGYRFNGGAWHTVPNPLPSDTPSWVGFVAQVPLDDLRQGDNTLQFRSNGTISWSPDGSLLANVDLEVGDLAGIGTVPVATATPTASPVPATPTAVPTATPAPVATETPTAVPTTSATSTSATTSATATVTTTQTVTSAVTSTVTVTSTATQTITQTVTATQTASTAFSLACTRSGASIACTGQ